MKKFLVFFLLLSPLVQAQTNPSLIRKATRPVLDGVQNMSTDAIGQLILTAKTGPSRTAPVPTLAGLSTIRSFTGVAPQLFYCTDNGYAGEFKLDMADDSTLDDGGMVLKTTSNLRYKRVLSGPINPMAHYGAKGTGKNTTDDTDAIQKAILAACRANDPQKFIGRSPAKGFSNTVFIPHGIYRVTHEIKIPGSCTIEMEQATSYGGTRIQQVTPGEHLFHITRDTDGGSSGVHFIGGILKGGVATSAPDVALVYGGIGGTGENANNFSTYFDYVWFQTPETYAINIMQGGDVLIRNCTFDVSGVHAIKFGSKVGSTYYKVFNSRIIGNTFYDIRAGVIDLIGGDNIIIADNQVYGGSDVPRSPYFVNAYDLDIHTLTIINNQIEYVDKFITMSDMAQVVKIAFNTAKFCQGKVLELGGGKVIKNLQVTNNTFTGDFDGSIDLGGGKILPDAPIFGADAGFEDCNFTDNHLTHINSTAGSTTAVTPFLLTDSRNKNNTITGNKSTGFLDKGQIARPLLNGLPQSFTYSTSSWSSTSGFNQIVAPGTLEDNQIYSVKLRFDNPTSTLTITTQAFLVAGVSTSSTAASTASLASSTANYDNNPNQSFSLRYKPGSGTLGLEAAPNVLGLAGKLTVTIYPHHAP